MGKAWYNYVQLLEINNMYKLDVTNWYQSIGQESSLGKIRM